jgi:subtilisin family serine protease
VSLSLLVACPAKNIPDPVNPPSEPCPQANVIESQARQEKFLTAAQAVPGEYIVVLKAPAPGEKSLKSSMVAESLTARFGGNVFFTYEHALRGFASRMTEEQARAMAAAPEVEYVEQNGRMSIGESQPGATWGIDRLDQHDLPLNQTYLYNASGRGVHAYIIDTGIRISHSEFGGRADFSFDSIGDGQKGNDCNGHGTHVAATVGGNLYGVAKNVQLHAVRVLDCGGSGTYAGVIAGVDWVANNRQLPAVANMSLGGGKSDAVDDAVRRAIAAGVTFVVAAGNENADACTRSPARTREAITVGATGNNDARASFSNWGGCVDVFAPGNEILSAWPTNDASTRVLSGTSMASPHVAGVAALFLERNASATPAAVTAALVDNSTGGKVVNRGKCSPNRLMFSGFLDPTFRPATQTAQDGK